MKLVSAIMAKNEADRYLTRVIQRCQEFSDTVLLLDDRSTDNTAGLAESLGCQVKGRSILAGNAWGNETPARADLWSWAAEVAGDGWLLVCDADMILEGDPRPLTKSVEMNAWAWPLWDCWDSEERGRVDGAWQIGPTTPRPWLFRPSACPEPQWSGRGIHAGHCPSNFPGPCGIAPQSYFWRHLSYLKAADRAAKREQYRAVEAQLTEFEKAHAASITA